MWTPSEEDIRLLEANGWTVECVSPFEISFDEIQESRATGYAAHLILQIVQEQQEEE